MKFVAAFLVLCGISGAFDAAGVEFRGRRSRDFQTPGYELTEEDPYAFLLNFYA